MLSAQLHEDQLRQLAAADCPADILDAARKSASGNSEAVDNAVEVCTSVWPQLRNCFCNIMEALKNPRDKNVTIAHNHIDDLISHLSSLVDFSPNEILRGVLRNAHSGMRIEQQQDCDEFSLCLAQILGLDFSNHIRVEEVHKVRIASVQGIPVDVPLGQPGETPAGSRLAVFLPEPNNKEYENGGYFQRCLDSADLPSDNTATIEGDDYLQRVEQAFASLRQGIENKKIHVNNRVAAMRDIRTAQKNAQSYVDAGRRYPTVDSTRVRLGSKCDSLAVQFGVFGFKPAQTLNYQHVDIIPQKSKNPIPEQYHMSSTEEGTDEIGYLRDKQTGKKYLVNFRPCGGPRATTEQSAKHAEASMLVQSFYKSVGLPVVPCVMVKSNTYQDETGEVLTHLCLEESPDKNKRPDFRQDNVSRVLSSDECCEEVWGIIFDAWLGNRHVCNGRDGGLGILEPVNKRGKSTKKSSSTKLFRTQFSGLGYKLNQPEPDAFNENSVGDLRVITSNTILSAADRIDICRGLKALGLMTNDVIADLVNNSNFGSVAEKNQLIRTLIVRRNNLLNMTNIRDGHTLFTSYQHGDVDAFKPALHHENIDNRIKHVDRAINAFVDSSGEISLPAVDSNDESVQFTGIARCIVCHMGESLNEGHYLSLFRRGDTWFILDDSPARRGVIKEAIPVGDVLDSDEKSDTPNSIEDVMTFLQKPNNQLAPYLVVYERTGEGVETRPEWEPEFEHEVLKKWRQNREGNTEDDTSSVATSSDYETSSQLEAETDQESEDESELDRYSTDSKSEESEDECESDEESVVMPVVKKPEVKKTLLESRKRVNSSQASAPIKKPNKGKPTMQDISAIKSKYSWLR